MGESNLGWLVRIRMVLWLTVGLAIIGAALLFWNQGQSEVSGFGGPFEMQSTSGGTFSRDDLAGTPSIILFGFTSCPDVCPTTLTQMTRWREEVKLDENQLRIIFVSIDPDRDTNEKMQEYLARFSSPIIGLTGTRKQVDEAKISFGVFAEKIIDPNASEEEQANYDMDHTASVLMFGRDGEFKGTINFDDRLADILVKISELAGN